MVVILMALQRMRIKVSEEMHEWLKVESEKRGLTMNAIVYLRWRTITEKL